MKRVLPLLIAFLLSSPVWSQEAELRMARLGDFELESGAVIQDLEIGYRTLGTPNEEGSNAVLFPTWFTGTSEDLLEHVGADRLVDPAVHYVILVDAIGNGVSTSPSNSTEQPGMKFPRFSIRDMVRSQYQLLTEVLEISRLKAVIGMSMGGMQSFEWVISYPDFVTRAVPIHGSPRLASYDRLLWTAEIRVIQDHPDWQEGEYSRPPRDAMKTVAAINSLALRTPGYVNQETSPETFEQFLSQATDQVLGFDANNWIRQAQAMLGHDIYDEFGGSMERAAEAIRAELLVIVGMQDHMVTPGPALELADQLLAPTIRLQSGCGHLAVWCEEEKVMPAVRRFLSQ